MKRPLSAETPPARRGVSTPLLRTALLVFLFLRFFYDGLSSPLFTHVSNAAFVVLAAVRVARSRFGATRLEAAQALFVLLAVGFAVLTVVGIWFRGPGMRLVWPWNA